MPERVPAALAWSVLAFLYLPVVFLLLSAFIPGESGVEYRSTNFANFALAADGYLTHAAVGNSLFFAVGSAMLATSLGALGAWLQERTDLGIRQWISLALLLPLFVPGVLYTMAWISLANPRSGWLNNWASTLSLPWLQWDIYSWSGMIWVEGLRATSVVFLLCAAALRGLDPAREWAARLGGAGTLGILRRVLLPAVWPALVGGFVLSLMRGLGTFEVPAMLGVPAGIPVFITAILDAHRDYLGDLGPAAATAFPLLLLALALAFGHELAIRRRMTGSSPAFQQTHCLITIGPRWVRFVVTSGGALVVLLLAGLPLLALVWTALGGQAPGPVSQRMPGAGAGFASLSFAAFTRVLTDPVVQQSALRTLLLCLTAGGLTMLVTTALAYLVERLPARTSALVQPVVDVMLGVPGVLLGLGLLVVFTHFDVGLYGTQGLLLLALVARYMPQGLRFARGGLQAVPVQLGQVASLAGAGGLVTFTRIELPLIAPGILAGVLYTAMAGAKDLSTVLLLYAPGQEVLTVTLWELWGEGLLSESAALGLVFCVPLIVVAILVDRFDHGGRV